MSLPKNQASATYKWLAQNRYQKHPRANRNPNVRPQNSRLRCNDCSAQFHEATQATKMDVHCRKMGAGTAHGHPQYGTHHGWVVVTPRQNYDNTYRIISDSITAMNEWNKENGY